MQNQKGFIQIILVAIIISLVGVGSYFAVRQKTLFNTIINPNPLVCTQEEKSCPNGSYVSRTGSNCEFAQCSGASVFGSAINFTVGKQIKFSDGLVVTLKGINDSRCKPGTVCFWAGELSPVFTITGGNADNMQKEIRLGSLTGKKITSNGYVFELKNATETSVIIIINSTRVTCEYPVSPSGCTYEKGPDYNQKTMCGMVLECQNGKQIYLKEGQMEGPLLVEKIHSDYILGLNYLEYPVAVVHGQPIILYVGESVSNGCTITLTLVKIENNTAVFTEKTYFNKPCPKCLAENTLVDTPDGKIPVQELQKGMAVWTVDGLGKRIATTIIKNSKTPVPQTHQMVHIILNDKREIFASPGHPIGDGRVFNDLSVGDILDGSRVINAEKVLYNKGYTYDILPSGKTGFYWANGILIGSTLSK